MNTDNFYFVLERRKEASNNHFQDENQKDALVIVVFNKKLK